MGCYTPRVKLQTDCSEAVQTNAAALRLLMPLFSFKGSEIIVFCLPRCLTLAKYKGDHMMMVLPFGAAPGLVFLTLDLPFRQPHVMFV